MGSLGRVLGVRTQGIVQCDIFRVILGMLFYRTVSRTPLALKPRRNPCARLTSARMTHTPIEKCTKSDADAFGSSAINV